MSVSNDFSAVQTRRLCALVIGHKKDSPGAVSHDGSLSEFVFNEKLAMMIEGTVRQAEVQRVYRRTLDSLPGDINQLDPDFIISLHCNSFQYKATGTEVLYYHQSERGRKAAIIFQKHLVNHLRLKDRGIKPKNAEERGGYLLKYTKAPCLISEPFFISNNDDLARAQEDMDGFAATCAAAIDEISLNDEISGWKS